MSVNMDITTFVGEYLYELKSWLFDHRVAVAIASTTVLGFYLLRDPIVDYLRKRFKDLYVKDYLTMMDRLLKPFRIQLQKDLMEKVQELPAGKTLKIVEIGMGPGSSLQYYPKENVEIIAIEPNPYFIHMLEEKQKEYPQLTTIIKGYAEDLGAIADGSVDVVVSTLTLCSVSSLAKSVSEAKRILSKDGRFYFYEHQGSQDTWKRYFTQLIYEPYWVMMYDGCHLTRMISRAIEKAGFDVSHVSNHNIKFNYVMDPQTSGYAVRT